MCSSFATVILAVLLVLSTTAASAQWAGWPGYEPYCPWCYQQRLAPVREQVPVRRHREHKPAQVVHREVKVAHANTRRSSSAVHEMSVDEERASIKARVQSFCGRHPKDVACRPTQSGEPPKEP